MEMITYSGLVNGYQLFDATEYGLNFDLPEISAPEQDSNFFERYTSTFGKVHFDNYVGRALIGNLPVLVRSRKLRDDLYDVMLQDIIREIAQLPFSFNTPTGSLVYIRDDIRTDIIYHTFLILKSCFQELDDACEFVLKNPHRLLVEESNVKYAWEISRITPATIQSLVEHTEFWNDKQIYKAKSSQLLQTFDNPENRFVKFFLQLCLDIIDRFEQAIRMGNAPARYELLLNCSEMVQVINDRLTDPIMKDLGPLQVFPAQSTVLQRRQGYMEIFGIYQLLDGSLHLPLLSEHTTTILENKDLAELYELWTFFVMVRAVGTAFTTTVIDAVSGKETDFETDLDYEIAVDFKNGMKLWYNRTFSYSKSYDSHSEKDRKQRSYSVDLRPDITLQIEREYWIFDAKFRFDTTLFADQSSTEEETSRIKYESKKAKQMNADIVKMHAYKDAIYDARIAFVLYPNPVMTEIFRQRDGRHESCFHGVGAIPLLPGNEQGLLVRFLQNMQNPNQEVARCKP